jgi:hypothetical protein
MQVANVRAVFDKCDTERTGKSENKLAEDIEQSVKFFLSAMDDVRDPVFLMTFCLNLCRSLFGFEYFD